MKRPILWVLFYMISGILAGKFTLFSMWIVLPIAVFFIGTVLLSKLWHNKAPFIFLLCFFVGVISIYHSITPVKAVTQLADMKDTYVEGIVKNVEWTRNNKQRLKVISSNITNDETVVHKKSSFLVYFNGKTETSIGDHIAFQGTLQPFQLQAAKGTFNEFNYWKVRGYDYKCFTDKITITEKTKNSFFNSLYNCKNKLENIYDKIFPMQEAGVIKAMLIGDKGDVTELTRYIYKQAGIAHILAISGLHISIISMSAYYFFANILKQSRRKSSAIAIAVLPFFILITGFSPSAVRAAIMVMVGLMGNLFFRSGDSINNVGIAAVLILCIQPLYLWDIGFQLSFVTVTGIIIGMEWMEQLDGISDWIKNSVGVSFFATISSLPVTAYYFHSFSMAGFIINLVVVPLMEVLLIMGIITVIVGCFSIQTASIFGGIVFYILQLYEAICIYVAKLPWTTISIGKITAISAILCYIILMWIYFNPIKTVLDKGILGFLLLLLFFSFTGNRLFFHQNTIAFLDVGQGDSAVITTYDSKAFVIDGGGQYQKLFGHNTGKEVVIPYLEYQGIPEIDGLFLTHMDRDHGEGVLELMTYMPVKKVFISDYHFEKSDFYYSFLNIAMDKNVPVFLLKAGDTTELSTNMKISCLYPMKDEQWVYGDDNHGSTVLRLDCGNVSALFMGDAGYEDEEVMLEKESQLKCTILKAGHHGSKYSTSAEFLKEAAPEIAILSCGKNNRYGHPHEETLTRLDDAKVRYFQTKDSGTISVLTNGKNYKVKTMMEGY